MVRSSSVLSVKLNRQDSLQMDQGLLLDMTTAPLCMTESQNAELGNSLTLVQMHFLLKRFKVLEIYCSSIYSFVK